MSDPAKESSTLQSVIDSASGAVNSVIGSFTGNPADKQAAEAKQQEAQAKSDASHAGVSIGGYSASATGAITENDARRSEGSWNQTIGSGKETLGNLIGHEGLKQSGAEQNALGKGQEAQGQLSDLGQGVGDRVTGAIGGAVAGLTGNKQAEAAYQDQHDQGKSRQRGAEADIQKQAPQ